MSRRKGVRYVSPISNITEAQARAEARRTTRSNLRFLAMLALLTAGMGALVVLMVRLVVVVVKGLLPLLALIVIRLLQALVWVLAWTYALSKLGVLLVTRQRSLGGLWDAVQKRTPPT